MGPARSWAKAQRVPPGQESTGPGSRSFTNMTGWKGTPRELEQDPRRAGDALRLPGTLTEHQRPRESVPHIAAELPKELQRASVGARESLEAAQAVAPLGGSCVGLGAGRKRLRQRLRTEGCAALGIAQNASGAEAPDGGGWAACSRIPTAQAWEHSALGISQRSGAAPGTGRSQERTGQQGQCCRRVATTCADQRTLPPHHPGFCRLRAP